MKAVGVLKPYSGNAAAYAKDGAIAFVCMDWRQIAITRASETSWAVIVVLIDQPTTRRENRSITAAT